MSWKPESRQPALAETHRPCPVCVGVEMAKLRPAARLDLSLDYCRRCGGIWFDRGEVGALRSCRPVALYAHVGLRPRAHYMKCHACGASFDRNAAQCPACDRANALDCPGCSGPLQSASYQGLKLDACRACRGVWFDNVELAKLWNLKVEDFSRRAEVGKRQPQVVESDYFFLGDLLWAPDLVSYAAIEAGGAVGHAITALPDVAGSVAGGLADVAGNLVEGTGELAGSVFEGIGEVIGALFSVLDF